MQLAIHKPDNLSSFYKQASRQYYPSSGFTLLEILAVVFVVALIASIVVVNISRDEDKLALLEAKKFTALANHLQDESILQGYSLGITADLWDRGLFFFTIGRSVAAND